MQGISARQEEAFSGHLMQQAYRFRQEITSLQQKLTQRGFDLIKKQHELGRLKQQLQDATGKAERAQAAAAAMRCGISFY